MGSCVLSANFHFGTTKIYNCESGQEDISSPSNQSDILLDSMKQYSSILHVLDVCFDFQMWELETSQYKYWEHLL